MKIFGLLLLSLVCFFRLSGQVNYDEGRLEVLGVQLLQDHQDPSKYYYLPQFPSLAFNINNEPELLFMKYVGATADQSGGIFHALVTFTLSTELLEQLQAALEEKVAGAKVMGPVPLLPPTGGGEDGAAEFQVVSSILSNTGTDGAFTRSIVSSGHAPLLPGSKSAIAANLSPEGATLLWNSFTGPTSDVSVSLNACYEAWVRAYNATVQADMDVVYEHMSKVFNSQEGYTKRQLRKVTDELHRNGVLKVDVADRTAGLGIKAGELEGILNVVTDKLVEVMFNTETGWSKAPPREAAVEKGQLKGRQERGWITKLFKGSGDQPYMTDNQYVLKKRSDIQTNHFYLNLSKSTTMKFPVFCAGNLGGFYQQYGEDPKFFRVVDLNDPDFQRREVYFQIDGEYLDAFKTHINFVTVDFLQENPGAEATTASLVFSYPEIAGGKYMQQLSYPRLGRTDASWLNYKYRLNWSVRGKDKAVVVPEREGEWMEASAPMVSLKPPFSKKIVEIDVDRGMLQENGVSAVLVEFASTFMGEPVKIGRTRLSASDAGEPVSISLYFDPGEPIYYKVSWISSSGQLKDPLKKLEEDYLYLIPAQVSSF